MNIETGLIRKYNVPGPRYTSYPTAVRFGEVTESGSRSLNAYLKKRNQSPQKLSLYFHIPFCFSLCWYCGCTKVITKDQNRGDLYRDYLEKEMDLYLPFIHPGSEVIQIHFGGGTPTFLRPGQLHRLGNMIKDRFSLDPEIEFSVEIDPRRCTQNHIKALKQIGCNRASLGVQDTNPEVQKAVHRIQPFEQTASIIRWLREEGIDSLNFDLIYGLPRQTTDTFRKTLDDVLSLNPDRLAVYSYAHIPDRMPSQRLLKEEELPATAEKLGMMKLAVETLTDNGYRYIGMDHFAKETDPLTIALDTETLQRNFQGYSTHSGADLYAFGMSGISNVGTYYWQNSKTLNEYYASLNRSEPPVAKILTLTRDDLLRKEIIMQVMCTMGVNKHDIEQKWGIDFDDYFGESLDRLGILQKEELVTLAENSIEITPQGRLFLRNIAMCFDRYLSKQNQIHKFSKTV